MELPLPSNAKGDASNDLPFFAYGLFKPGQLGFHRIIDCVERSRGGLLDGTLLLRDGNPILDLNGDDDVGGQILYFSGEDASEEAYEAIRDVEPGHQYRWATTEVIAGGGPEDRVGELVSVNVLEGQHPQNGTSELAAEMWDGRNDPLFTSALEMVEECLSEYSGFDWEDTRALFQVQMAYLLLWSSIERYVSLRYGLKGTQGETKMYEKRHAMAEETAVAEGAQSVIPETRQGAIIYRSDRPHVSVQLDPVDPKSVIDYYWQVRSNLAHRGKSAPLEFEMLHQSSYELLRIFRDFVLPSAFSIPGESIDNPD